jgi:hypothetical protein
MQNIIAENILSNGVMQAEEIAFDLFITPFITILVLVAICLRYGLLRVFLYISILNSEPVELEYLTPNHKSSILN